MGTRKVAPSASTSRTTEEFDQAYNMMTDAVRGSWTRWRRTPRARRSWTSLKSASIVLWQIMSASMPRQHLIISQHSDLTLDLEELNLIMALDVAITMMNLTLALLAQEARQLTWTLASGEAWFPPLMRLHLPKRPRQGDLMELGMIQWILIMVTEMLGPRRARMRVWRMSSSWMTSLSALSNILEYVPFNMPVNSAEVYVLWSLRSIARRVSRP